MTRTEYQAPVVDVVDVDCNDVITTSILLPPHEFRRKNNSQNREYDVF